MILRLVWKLSRLEQFYSVRYRSRQGSTSDFSRFYIILVSVKKLIFFQRPQNLLL